MTPGRRRGRRLVIRQARQRDADVRRHSRRIVARLLTQPGVVVPVGYPLDARHGVYREAVAVGWNNHWQAVGR
jgi:hypothetical protein